MKIFVSYSRRDAGDFANQIQRHLSTFNYDVFTDVDSIRIGEVWSNTIEQNISNCEIFVIIVTDGSLHSPHVEREVLQAQKEKKIIIPCFHRTVIGSDIKWGLDKIQGVEFDEKYELARNLQSKLSSSKGKSGNYGSTSKIVEESKINETTQSKSDVDILQENKNIPQPLEEKEHSKNLRDILKPFIIKEKRKATLWSVFTIALTGIFLIFIYLVFFSPDHLKEYHLINSWGSTGSGTGQLMNIQGISVDSSKGEIYVADTNNERIQKFDSNGKFITQWGGNGTGDGQFISPRGISIDSSTGNVYVTDTQNNRIQKFDSNGTLITKWGSYGGILEDGKFYQPYSISIDSSTGNVYVADSGNNRIQKFDSNGIILTKWGKRGNDTGQFISPRGISVDSSKREVYVADTYNDRIQKFDSNGKFITQWGGNGTGDGQFISPRGISIDSSTGNVYVTDSGNKRIQKFDSNGNFITKWEIMDINEELSLFPYAIAVEPHTGYVYVSNSSDDIQVFAPGK